MTMVQRRLGDFTGLAESYSRHRPGYAESIASAVLALVNKPMRAIDAVDVGAGTGIWTQILARHGVRSVIAVEPNDDMRRHGVQNSRGLPILWRAGSGEATGLDTGCADLVSMASSFHWVDFDRGMSEFARLLRRGGRFVALWNPRLIEVNPLLVEIEAHLASLAPGLKRVSSGRSGLTANLTERLWAHADFDDVVYLEGRHAQIMTPAQYLGVWRSVNDLQAQLGPNLFAEFLDYVEQRVAAEGTIEATYLTRAWSARRR